MPRAIILRIFSVIHRLQYVTMKSLAGSDLLLPPCTTLHDSPPPKCACRSSGSLEELPFLHTIVENAPHSYIARGYNTICRSLCWLFGLFPIFIRRMLYRALKIFDNLFLLCACYVEHAHPWAFVRLWGPKNAPGAKTAAQSLISMAGMCLQRVSIIRVGPIFSGISSFVVDNMLTDCDSRRYR